MKNFIIVDRRGYAPRPPDERERFEVDVRFTVTGNSLYREYETDTDYVLKRFEDKVDLTILVIRFKHDDDISFYLVTKDSQDWVYWGHYKSEIIQHIKIKLLGGNKC